MKIIHIFGNKKTSPPKGIDTIYGIKAEITPILSRLRSPVQATYKNAYTDLKERLIRFDFAPDRAIALAASLSMVAESQAEAQSLIDEAFNDVRAVVLGAQDDSVLSERETMLCAAFFSLGLRAGRTAGLLADKTRIKAKKERSAKIRAGEKSPYWLKREEITVVIDEYIQCPTKKVVLYHEIKDAGGRENLPDKATVKPWLKNRLEGKPIFHKGE